MGKKFMYFNIGEYKFSLEMCNKNLYEVIVFRRSKLHSSICFHTYERAMEEILSYAEISKETWEED